MKHVWVSLVIALSAATFMMWQSGASAEKAKNQALATSRIEQTQEMAGGAAMMPTISIDKTSLSNGGTITVTGTVPAGKPVYLEVWSDEKVRVSRFDAEVDKETGKRPYILYMTNEMPAYYKIFLPKNEKEVLDGMKKEGKDWSFSKVLKDLGADIAYTVPARAKIDRYQATLMGSIIGSRGDLLSQLDEKESRQRSMQLVKARFRSVDKVLGTDVEVNPDGTYTASIKIREGLAPGKYSIVAVVDKGIKSQPATFDNNIQFPNLYLGNAGTSINLVWPFLLTLAISIFGVLIGAGGGFILNPLLVSLWPLPHTVVAGTVMPTVLFSQGSGIYNYSRIKFINWKLGITIGMGMVVGGFIGPKLTELITLDQYKFVFGWILIILASLMFWQTLPGYLSKNKKEQAILKEFKKQAEEKAKAKDN
jgi:uncharacterized protein